MSIDTSLWPVWLAVALSALLGANQLVTESEKFANLLGRAGRKLYARARERRRMDTVEFASAVRIAVEAERKRWEDDEARALKVVEGRLDFVTEITEAQQEQLKSLNFEVRCLTAYTQYETAWHNLMRRLIAKGNQNGGHVDIGELPPHMEYPDFEARCKSEDNFRWREWGIL